MFDSYLRPMIDPPLKRLGRALARRGITADTVTLMAFGAGAAAALAAAGGAFVLALGLFISGRMLDGLDGAVAAATRRTDRGGYLDIVLDFAIYAAIPLAFAVHDPSRNALPAAALLAAVVVNGAAFLAFAAVAARLGLETTAQGHKSLYFLAGLAEGGETIVVYAAVLWQPLWFPMLAYGFAALCIVSGCARVITVWRRLAPQHS